MALTLSGTDGVVGAGFTLDASGASVTAGVGTFGSLNAPAAGLTGALPAISAASLTQIPAANIVGVCTAGLANASGVLAGVTMIDSWVVTASYDINGSSDITSNWARHVAGGSQFGDIGDDMTESSGIFTFPSTGVYMVHSTLSGRADGTGGRSYIGMRHYYSTNSGGSYTNTASGYSSATTRKLIITVPASAPQLYYWCSIHSGMGGAINTNSTLGSSNFDGTIQSTVKANTTAGVFNDSSYN